MGDYLTKQPAFSEAKDFGRLNAREKELEQDMRESCKRVKNILILKYRKIGRERGSD